MRKWREAFAELGQAVLSLLGAELQALGNDFAASRRQASLGAVLLAVAAAFGFCALAVATFTLIATLSIFMPMWAAALVVTVFFGLIAAVTGFLGYRHLQKIRSPIVLVRERLDDHVDWWQHRLLRPTTPRAASEPMGTEPQDGPEDFE